MNQDEFAGVLAYIDENLSDKLSLKELAEEAGFSNANYLIRVFKKVTGQTIGEYRK